MDHRLVSRCLLTFLGGVQGIATVAIDLNKTHAVHPQWPGHARFHLVWQAATTFLLMVLAVAVLWGPWLLEADRFDLATALVSLPCLGFATAFFTRRLYGGTMSDPGGIRPIQVTLFRHNFAVDGNFLAVLSAIAVLSVVLLLHSR